MKVEEQIKQASREYTNRQGGILPEKVANAFIAGANFILDKLRWRDPKEELPTAGEPVIVKYRTAKNVEKHGIAKYFELGIGNPWTIEGSTGREVIGWKPIE